MIPPLQPTFEAALRDVRAERPRFRAAAAARLSDPPENERGAAVEGLLVLAEDPDGSVRAAAFEALGILGAREAAPILRGAFGDPCSPARQAAVLALARVDPSGSARSIAPLLSSSAPEMRFAAVWTLFSLGGAHVSDIEVALEDADPEVRALAAQCLADLGHLETSDRVAELLDDPDDEVRFTAATALASLGDDRGALLLREALRLPERAFIAAVGLGDLRDSGSHEALSRLARRWWRSPISRAAAARALVRLDDPAGMEIIRRMVRSWRIEARQYAVQLVGELGLTALLPDLRKSLRRSRQIERPVYETALEQLAPDSPEAEALLASLRAADHPG